MEARPLTYAIGFSNHQLLTHTTFASCFLVFPQGLVLCYLWVLLFESKIAFSLSQKCSYLAPVWCPRLVWICMLSLVEGYCVRQDLAVVAGRRQTGLQAKSERNGFGASLECVNFHTRFNQFINLLATIFENRASTKCSATLWDSSPDAS